jgi:superfamily II DNA or RNA helicase
MTVATSLPWISTTPNGALSPKVSSSRAANWVCLPHWKSPAPALGARTAHLGAIGAALSDRVKTLFTQHGRKSKKQRAALIDQWEALPQTAPRVLLSTGKLVGEGFDHPPLDTLVLAMPVSWKGTLQQYAGRLHREQANKTRARIIDLIDSGHPAL